MARPTRPNSQRYFTFLLFSNYSKFISKRILSKIMKYVLNLRTYLLTCMLLFITGLEARFGQPGLLLWYQLL